MNASGSAPAGGARACVAYVQPPRNKGLKTHDTLLLKRMMIKPNVGSYHVKCWVFIFGMDISMWPHNQVSQVGGCLHIFTAAISNYSWPVSCTVHSSSNSMTHGIQKGLWLKKTLAIVSFYLCSSLREHPLPLPLPGPSQIRAPGTASISTVHDCTLVASKSFDCWEAACSHCFQLIKKWLQYVNELLLKPQCLVFYF